MELADMQQLLAQIEPELPNHIWSLLATFERGDRAVHLALTNRLKRRAEEEGIWKSGDFCATLRNAATGLQDRQTGAPPEDGIFLLDRATAPGNEIASKLSDELLDWVGSHASEIAQSLEAQANALLPVLLVSRRLWLVGVLSRRKRDDWLVLVDCGRR